MNEDDEHLLLRQVLAAERLLDGAVRTMGEESAVVRGTVRIAGKPRRLLAVLRPHQAPVWRLDGPDRDWVTPHVGRSGEVCIGRRDTQAFQEATGLLVRETFQEAVSLLEEGLPHRNRDELRSEAAAYWERQKGVHSAVSLVGGGRKVREFVWRRDGKAPGVLFERREDYDGYYRNEVATEFEPAVGGLYVPLEPGTPVPLVAWDEPWTPRRAREAFMPHVRRDVRRELEERLQKRQKEVLVLFGFPLPQGGEAQLGLWFRGVRGRHPLRDRGHARRTQAVAVTRVDRPTLALRGGAADGLSGSHVLVVGCGAVGAHVAIELARAGVGRLTLMDKDRLGPENLYRHAVGLPAVGRMKSEVVTLWIHTQVPYVEVNAVVGDAWSELPEGPFDAVVLATGAQSLEMHVGARMRAADIPVICGWVEPLGVGGHALLSVPGSPGCLRCVYTDDEAELCPPRTALADPTVEFDLDLGGCGTRFTPHGSLAAVRTAVECVALTVDVLTGRRSEAVVKTWRGPADAVIDAGGSVTKYYGDPSPEWSDFAQESCTGCGGKR